MDNYTCFDCHKSFTSATELDDHRSEHAGDLHDSRSGISTTSKFKEREISQETYTCEVRNQTLERKSSLLNHVQIHSEGTNDPGDRQKKHGGDQFDSRSSNLNDCEASQETNTSEVCNKTFERRTSVLSHVQIHNKGTDESDADQEHVGDQFDTCTSTRTTTKLNGRDGSHETHTCEVCNKTFERRASLLCHVQIHNDGAPCCTICGKRFKCAFDLKVHSFVHTREKLHECKVCKRSFSLKSNLKTHYRVHSDEKPYSCDICNKGFKYMSALAGHRKVHTGERPFGCPVCGEHFRERSKMQRHVSIVHASNHANKEKFQCSICNLEFKSMIYLKRHEQVHTGEKNYSCETCGKRFRQGGTLRRHLLIHTGEKPYGCSECGKAFAHSPSLRKHILAHAKRKVKIANLSTSQ